MLLLFVLLALASATTRIHIVPHTHDDVGWLKTVDEYYLGANQSIQEAGVQYILDSVVPELEKDPSRTFIYVEIAFFFRWWREQDSAMQERVKTLVRSGQLEFINGGWCMNDESAPSDEAMITQMTRGHTFLRETFGITPTVGWQVDPFGHSNTMMSLFSQMGFSSVFFARIDYQDYAVRKNSSRLEWVWRPSQSLGVASDIFAHAMWDTTYCWPAHFNFQGDDAPINDDAYLENVNVQQRADEFAAQMAERAQYYRTGDSDILVAMGCDFAYANANVNYKNTDKLMRYINAHPERYNITLMYSTPSRYAKAVNERQLEWSLKEDDIFPYADNPYAYWTGYMTSRPALKGYVRSRNAVLRWLDKYVASFLTAQASQVLDSIAVLRDAFSVTQHHDAVAGTEKQHVADDYAKLLANGTAAAHGAVAAAVAQKDGIAAWQFCERINETICDVTTSATSSVVVQVHNSLAWKRIEPVTIPGSLQVEGVASQITHDFQGRPRTTFFATVAPLGFASYVLSPSASKERSTFDSSGSIGNEYYNVSFAENAIVEINGRPFSLEYLWYNESAGNNANSSQAGGAYIFRPNSTTPFSCGSPANLVIEKGPVLEVARLTYGDWVQVELRVYHGRNYLELISQVGPIPIADQNGKNVVHRFHTPVQNGGEWFTDAGWEEMQRRQFDHRPTWTLNVTNPVAGNYYPVNQAAFLRDSTAQFTVLTDRSRGCASLSSGEFESMLHRRLLTDDSRGVGEPLNETEAIITTERLILDTPSPSFRVPAMTLNHPFQLTFTTSLSAANVSASGLLQPLPANLHLMDYYLVDETHAIIRFRHLYASSEASPYSDPVSIDLQQFLPRELDTVAELQLTAVQPVSSLADKLKWKVAGEAPRSPVRRLRTPSTSISFAPMQIRTFGVTFKN